MIKGNKDGFHPTGQNSSQWWEHVWIKEKTRWYVRSNAKWKTLDEKSSGWPFKARTHGNTRSLVHKRARMLQQVITSKYFKWKQVFSSCCWCFYRRKTPARYFGQVCWNNETRSKLYWLCVSWLWCKPTGNVYAIWQNCNWRKRFHEFQENTWLVLPSSNWYQ